jgi:hypothetical protein
MLRKAAVGGLFKSPAYKEHLRNDLSLGPIRPRADFQDLLRRLEVAKTDGERGCSNNPLPWSHGHFLQLESHITASHIVEPVRALLAKIGSLGFVAARMSNREDDSYGQS